MNTFITWAALEVILIGLGCFEVYRRYEYYHDEMEEDKLIALGIAYFTITLGLSIFIARALGG